MKFGKFTFCILFFFGAVFLSVGCDSKRDGVGNNSVLEISDDGRVYNNDPDGLIYYDAYGDAPIERVVDDADGGGAYATYILGYVYYSNFPQYGVEQDVDKGLELIKQSWEMGVVDAGYTLYRVYSQGRYVEKNADLATAYLEKSAEKGFVLSQRTLAEDYSGYGDDYFDTNQQLALEWYTRAAEQGDRVSAIALAKIYHEGLGVVANDEQAFAWVSRSEDMKYGTESLAISALAQCDEEGIGTSVDLVQAYKYHDLMGTAGIHDKERLSEQMTPEQIQEAIRLSGEWQREHNISMPNSEGYHYR